MKTDELFLKTVILKAMKAILIIILIFCFKISFSQTSESEKINKEQIEKQKQQNNEDNSKKMNAASEANYKKYLEENERAKNQNTVKYSSTQKDAKPIAPNPGNTGNNQIPDNKDVQVQPDFSKMSAGEKQAFEKQKQQNIEDDSKKMNAESEANYKKYLEEKERANKQNSIKYSSTQKDAKVIEPNLRNTGNNQIPDNKDVQVQPDFSKMSAGEKEAFEKQKQQNIEDVSKKLNAESDAKYKKYLEEQERLKKQPKSQGSTSTKMAEEKK